MLNLLYYQHGWLTMSVTLSPFAKREKGAFQT